MSDHYGVSRDTRLQYWSMVASRDSCLLSSRLHNIIVLYPIDNHTAHGLHSNSYRSWRTTFLSPDLLGILPVKPFRVIQNASEAVVRLSLAIPRSSRAMTIRPWTTTRRGGGRRSIEDHGIIKNLSLKLLENTTRAGKPRDPSRDNSIVGCLWGVMERILMKNLLNLSAKAAMHRYR